MKSSCELEETAQMNKIIHTKVQIADTQSFV